MIAKIVLDVELGLGDAAISLNLKFPASWGSYVAGRSNMNTHRMRPPLARIKIAACLAITFSGVNSANAEVVIKPEDLIGNVGNGRRKESKDRSRHCGCKHSK